MKSKYIVLMAVAAVMSACNKEGWRVEGNIDNAPEDAVLAVEGFNAGRWYTIDSVAVTKNGHFSYVSPEGSPYPDIYRVSLDGRSIYFPIDSLESITITANGANFDQDYTIEGWPTAVEMMRIDQRIAKAVAEQGTNAVLCDSVLKRELSIAINEDTNGILGYYIVNKTVGGQPLFSTANRSDLRMIGALANKFMTLYPNDPRTVYLCARFLQARADLNPEASTQYIEATETGLFDIELYDAQGNKRKLSDVAKDAGLTILSFTAYQADGSIPYNVELNRIYELFRPQSLAIYQVSLDSDEVQWRKSAANLPWTAVWYDNKDGGQLPLIYNLSVIPSTFIIDRNGDLVDRVDDPSQIETAVRKHI